MAATQLLSIAKTAANSADLLVVAGSPITVALKITAGEAFPPSAVIDITLKDDAGVYAKVGALDADTAEVILSGPGTYRLERRTISDTSSTGVGAFSDGVSLSNTSAVLSGAAGFSLPSAGFSNPMYLGGATSADSTGFDVSPYQSIITAFEGTYTGATGTLQGTLDPTGATGWFSMTSITLAPAATNAPSTAMGTSGTAYSVPCAGVQRVRWALTALATGTITVRVSGGYAFNEHQTAQIGAVGMAAHDAVVSGAPVRVGAKALTANAAAVATGDTADLITTLVGALITKPFSIPEGDWAYAAASGGIVDTADNVLTAAGAAGIRNYLTHIDLVNTDATVGTEVVVKDGSTVIWRTFVPASLAAVSQPMPVSFNFPTPLRGTAATALNVACITTSSQTYVNACGYKAP